MYSNNNKHKPNNVLESFIEELSICLAAGLTALVTKLSLGLLFLMKKFKERNYPRPVSQKQLKSKKVSRSENTVGYLLNDKKPLTYKSLDTRTHTGIFGTTGSGKTVLMKNLITQSLVDNKAVIFFDPKPTPESLAEFRRLAFKFNRPSYAFMPPWSISRNLNPLAKGTIVENVSKIMNALEWSETYYKNECQLALFQAITRICEDGNCLNIERILDQLVDAPNKKTISSLIGQLILIYESEYGGLLDWNDDPCTIEQIRQEGACLYVGIPALGSGSIGEIVNKLLFGDILRHVNDVITGKSPTPENSIAIFFDELSSTVHEGFIDLLNKCRAAKADIFYATQSPSDLEKVSPWFLSQVLENTNNFFVFNQTVPKHTEMFAGLAGTATITKDTHVIEQGVRSGRSSERETETFLIHPNIFRELRVGQCAFIQRKPWRKHDVLNVKMLVESDVTGTRFKRNSIF